MDPIGLGLGVLERVDIRQAFSNEPQVFTPWLVQNLHLLAAELGMEGMQQEGTEVSIGSYRADIVATLPDDTKVVIENQLEVADLKHLGQILAYLAGLGAQVVIWVATRFDDVHLTAIRWLNEHTSAPFAFFAVAVGAVRIGDSKIAPTFEVQERPDGWVRKVQGTEGQFGEHSEIRREFWTYYKDHIPSAGIPVGDYTNIRWSADAEEDDRVHLHVFKRKVSVYVAAKSREEEIDEQVERLEERFEGLGGNFTLRNGRRLFETVKLVDIREKSNWDEILDWFEQQRAIYLEILAEEPSDQADAQ